MNVHTEHGWNSGSMGTAPSYRSRVVIAIVLALGAIALAGIVALLIMLMMSTPAVHPSRAPSPVPSQAASTNAYDPYPVYFVNSPIGVKHLTREDAQARAYLGCGQTFAPGTVDAALADAYRPAGICN
jgi:hypothetical protein